MSHGRLGANIRTLAAGTHTTYILEKDRRRGGRKRERQVENLKKPAANAFVLSLPPSLSLSLSLLIYVSALFLLTVSRAAAAAFIRSLSHLDQLETVSQPAGRLRTVSSHISSSSDLSPFLPPRTSHGGDVVVRS